MIQITTETDLSSRSLLFVAGEDDVRSAGESTGHRERWVLEEVIGGNYQFKRFPDSSYAHAFQSRSRTLAVKSFLDHTEWNPALYSFQSQAEMEQWLNSK